MSHDPSPEINARWLDDCAAPPGSTVWVIWVPTGGLGTDIKAIVSTFCDAKEWAKQQLNPKVYRFSEWRVLGAGWPSEAPNQTKE